MVNNISRKTWVTTSVLAIVAAIVFIVIQLISGLSYDTDTTQRPISKEAAIEKATQFVNEQTGLSVTEAEAYHSSNKDYTGYLAKYKLNEEHKQKFEKYLPVDQYMINVLFDGNNRGSVYLNLYTGEIIGWNFKLRGTQVEQATAYEALNNLLAERNFPLGDKTHIDTYEQIENFDIFGTERVTTTGYYVSNDDLTIKDAVFQFDSSVIVYGDNVIVSKLMPDFILPSDYVELVEKQDMYANIWTYGVYMAITFVLGILAIIYAVLYRRHTSFKFGIWLTVIATIISAIINLGMMKSQLGLQGDMLSGSDLFTKAFFIAIIIVTIIAGTVSYYFSFVAGDGLWRAQGFQLWPRFRDAHYGKHVWDSMKIGYLMAIIGLGVQNVIFLILTVTLGTWSANDTSQSLLNFEFSWLYPAIAWFAAITEEAVFRFFGVGIFRRWFKNTWIAALIPTIAWAAGHTLYPLYPASTRVIELLIIGYLFTWVMIRFGLIAAMFMHASFNTILIGISMIISGTTGDVVSACIFLVLPFIIAFVIKWLHDRKKNTGDANGPQYPPVMPQQ